MKNKELVEINENKFGSVSVDTSSEGTEEENSSEVEEEESSSEVEEESEEESSDPEHGESNEASENETVSVVAYDYTSYFENIQNANTFQVACLVAILILLGLLMGLRKHD